jgi:glycosyltransferase involved in cell wall biosynthesis
LRRLDGGRSVVCSRNLEFERGQLKVCFISGSLPDVSCGIGDYVDSLAMAITRRGHEVVVFTTAAPELRTPREYRVVALKTDWSVRDTSRIAAAVQREDPAVLHLQYPGVGYGRAFGACLTPWALRLRRHRPMLAVTLHEFHTFRLRRRLRLAAAFAACDLVIAPDPTVLAAARKSLAWRPRLRSRLIPLASSIWPATTGPGASGPGPEDLLTVGHWGFLRPDKGVEVLLEAFATVRQSRPARLILAGDPGPDAQYVEFVRRRAQELGISESIETTGKLTANGLSAALSSFDVCCLPFRDGLTENRTTYSGAVAHGLYIATTDSVRTGFDPATNTTFIRPGDRDALASAILDAPVHPRKPTTNTAETAWDQIADAHLAAYAELAR